MLRLSKEDRRTTWTLYDCLGGPDVILGRGGLVICECLAGTRKDMELIKSAPDLRRALADLINEAQPLGIDRPAYQTALALLVRLESKS